MIQPPSFRGALQQKSHYSPPSNSRDRVDKKRDTRETKREMMAQQMMEPVGYRCALVFLCAILVYGAFNSARNYKSSIERSKTICGNKEGTGLGQALLHSLV
jgi:L-amino acid N-acyltransferase YncA